MRALRVLRTLRVFDVLRLRLPPVAKGDIEELEPVEFLPTTAFLSLDAAFDAAPDTPDATPDTPDATPDAAPVSAFEKLDKREGGAGAGGAKFIY